MSSSLQSFQAALQSFSSSGSSFRVLRTIPEPVHESAASRLYILDSSFNPPTRAHRYIVRAALQSKPEPAPSRILLLLATQNADKAPKPASFNQRLEMMAAFARDLIDNASADERRQGVIVDIGVTKSPYFVDKSKAIAAAGEYNEDSEQNPLEQVHLVGYDTLVRVLDPKYYPPKHTLESLGDLFGHHSLRVMLRDDEQLGSGSTQRDFVRRLRSSEAGLPGWQAEWAKHIEVDEATQDEAAISSTKARSAASAQDISRLKDLCTTHIVQYLQDNQLYVERS